ncbi:MAG: polysaccharide deacetylase family protein [Candidatus Solibacter sp.]
MMMDITQKSRTVAKQLLGNALWPFVTRQMVRHYIGRDQGLILMFHYIGAPIIAGVSTDLFLSLDEFRRILDFVRSKLCPLEPDEFLSRLKSGSLPPAATLLTFDDCVAQTVRLALPELTKRGLKACFFANPGLMDTDRTLPSLELMELCGAAPEGAYCIPGLQQTGGIVIDGVPSKGAAFRALWPSLVKCPSRLQTEMLHSIRHEFGVKAPLPECVRLADWEELSLLHQAGMLVGNHTMYHSTVDADGIDQFAADVEEGYQMIEARLPWRARVFCYPYGRKVDATRETAQRLHGLGTKYGFVTQGGAARVDGSGTLNLRREEAAYSVGATKLAPALALMR